MKLFKDSFSYENRCEESTRIKNKYPHRVPIIVEKAKNCILSDPDKKKYLVPNDMNISIAVFDIAGREIESVYDGMIESGYHTITWNADNFSSGIYFVNMISGDFSTTRKITLLK